MNDVREQVIVFSGDATDANLAWSSLEGHGIHAELIGEPIGSMAPYIAAPGGAGSVQVAVAKEDNQAALGILSAGR